MKRFFSSIRGDAVIECAVVIPIWILVNYMAYEGLRMYTTYRALTASLRESMVTAGLSAVSSGNLIPLPTPYGGSVTFSPGSSVTSRGNSYSSCIPIISTALDTAYSSADNDCPALIMAERIRMILDAAKFNISGHGQNVTIGISVTGAGSTATVNVRVNGFYSPSLNLLRGLIPIGASANGPWSVTS